MAEYIERSEAIEFVKQNTPTIDGETTMQCVVRSLKNVPSADVVEVVRCSKCQHGRSCVDKDEVVACLLESEWDDDLGIDYGFVTYHSNNHYCSYGERRSE